MAAETQKPAPEASAATAEHVATSEEKQASKDVAVPPAAPAAAEEDAEKPAEDEAAAEEGEKEATVGLPQSASFKEESNVVADLEDPEKKALDELKELVKAALANNEFTKPPPRPAPKEEKPAEKGEEHPAAEAPKADEAAAEGPKAEEPRAAEASKVDEPPVEGPAKVEDEAPKADAKEEEPPKPEEVAETSPAAVDATVTPAAAAEDEKAALPPPVPEEEVFLWGVPLLGHEKSDTVLLKFLRARDFKAKEALSMLRDAVIWRKEFVIETLLEEDLALPELEKVVFTHGHDREGHPVCYNVYGEFQDRELYQKVLADDEKRRRFLRWRIQFLERGIRQQLDFAPSGISSMVQVTDLKNSPGPAKWELRQATKQVLALLQDNYPELVAKQVFINVPWWYLAFNRMISPFLTQRTRSKFVFAGPSKSSETLFKYIAPEQVPVQYGGLSKENDPDFTIADAVTEIIIKPSAKHTIEIPVSETCLLVWELRVLGWDVSYGAEFVPSAEDGYTVIVQKARKFSSADEPLVKNSFKIGEPGKVVLTVDNSTSKKKKLLYRSKAVSAAESV